MDYGCARGRGCVRGRRCWVGAPERKVVDKKLVEGIALMLVPYLVAWAPLSADILIDSMLLVVLLLPGRLKERRRSCVRIACLAVQLDHMPERVPNIVPYIYKAPHRRRSATNEPLAAGTTEALTGRRNRRKT